jgi:phosphoribosylamine--glycine ligase
VRILLIGNGGREHALAWRLSQSRQVTQIWVAPGNGGTQRMDKCENVPLGAGDLEALRDFAVQQQVDLTVVGPEAPLVEGVVDLFQAARVSVFGPVQAAAQIEGSKAFSKQFMQQAGIPTAQAGIFDDFDEATRYLRGLDEAPVIKASGLAAGKGVILPESKAEAAAVLQTMLLERRFGSAGETVLIEERLSGPELSVLAFCDGKTARVMPPAQDQGPNTGGMGAFAPSPLATAALLAEVQATILQPTLDGLAAQGTPYVGVLYAGLMLTPQGPRVLEYNCRFGDPETQVLLPLLDSDLVEVMLACVEGRLAEVDLRWRPEAAVTVVMAARGYPGEYESGVPITRIAEAEATGCRVFHAGTKWKEDRLLTAGGRVLAVTALGPTLEAAAQQAYTGVECIHFNGAHFRRDIAQEPPAPRKRRGRRPRV